MPKPALNCAILLALAIVLNPALHSQIASPSPAAESQTDEQSLAEGHLIHQVRSDLAAEQFDTLDRTADGFRRSKARWPGGGWKLRVFYEALDFPHQTEPDMVAHLEHLRHWMTLRPESISARVALATSLTRWAWVARGNGVAKTVSDSGWQLFGQRIQEAQVVLETSRDMHTMDPQWYCEEMIVGKAQGWDDHRVKEVFERAVQFEPDYQYFYKSRTEYLLPKWYGKPNEATDFAKSAADKVGGDLGDYIYWEIATVIIKKGNGNLQDFLAAMDWQRIQRGYQTLQTRFQTNSRSRNELAFMAFEYKDRSIAQQQFGVIGTQWSRSVWRDQNYFEKVRDWSNGRENWP
jgi:hypothetical protein